MAEIKIREIYTGDPNVPGPALAALRDILAQPINSRFARKVRKLKEAIQKEIDITQEQHQAILDRHLPKDEHGKPKPIKHRREMVDADGFDREFNELLDCTFEIEPLSFAMLEGMGLDLKGGTWASSLLAIDDEKSPEEEKAE
jgi:hypothetical protein